MFEPSARDTTPEAQAVLDELVRRAPVWKRMEILFDLIEMNVEMIKADLRSRYPNADAKELHKRYAARVLSREEVIKVFDWDPEVEGY
jgi:hypothetical protein